MKAVTPVRFFHDIPRHLVDQQLDAAHRLRAGNDPDADQFFDQRLDHGLQAG